MSLMKVLLYAQIERLIVFVTSCVAKIRVCADALRCCDDLPKYSNSRRLGACGVLGQTRQNASFGKLYPVLQGEPFDGLNTREMFLRGLKSERKGKFCILELPKEVDY